jgi:hypothetical protein
MDEMEPRWYPSVVMPLIDRSPRGIFTKLAGEMAEHVEDLRLIPLENGWDAVVGFASPGRDVVARIVTFFVVPSDPSDIPQGGLSHRQLREAITGLADLGADVSLERWQKAFGSLGRPWTPEVEKPLKRELRRLGRKQGHGGRGNPYPDAFYARVAWDAVELAQKGRQGDVINALELNYAKPGGDPRPKERRKKPITYATVKGWYEQAKDRGFLVKPGRKGVRVTAATERLIAFTRERGIDGRT